MEQSDVSLAKLSEILNEINQVVADDTAFIKDSPKSKRLHELSREYNAIAKSLSPFESYAFIRVLPQGLEDINSTQPGAEKIRSCEARLSVEEETNATEREIASYRTFVMRVRRELARNHIPRLVKLIDEQLGYLVYLMGPDTDAYDYEEWEEINDTFDLIRLLTKDLIPRTGRWREMLRHLSSGRKIDLHEILSEDWPSIRLEIQENRSKLDPSEADPTPSSGQAKGSGSSSD